MDRPDLYSELLALNADYWARVDVTVDDPIDMLFTEDGRMAIGTGLDLRGREAIRSFFDKRNAEQAAAGRRTRHVHTNLYVEPLGADRAKARSMIVVFAGVGALPLPASAPTAIADVEDICVRGPDGRWRFETRMLQPIFIGAGAAGFVKS